MEATVYEILLTGRHVTMPLLIDELSRQSGRAPRRWEPLRVVGEMIANREVFVSESGRVHIA